jgi:hypothetical protein
MHRLLDLRDKHQRPLDVHTLALLVQAAVDAPALKPSAVSVVDVTPVSGVAEDAAAVEPQQQQQQQQQQQPYHADNSAAAPVNGALTGSRQATVAGDESLANRPLARSVAELLGRIAATAKSDARVWEVYAVFNEKLQRGADRVADCRAKQVYNILLHAVVPVLFVGRINSIRHYSSYRCTHCEVVNVRARYQCSSLVCADSTC